MSGHDRELSRLARSFLGEEESFWGFHEGFLNCWTRLPSAARSEAARCGWNEIYAWVLRAIPDPVPAEDAARGVIGERELRSRLRRHRLLATPR